MTSVTGEDDPSVREQGSENTVTSLSGQCVHTITMEIECCASFWLQTCRLFKHTELDFRVKFQCKCQAGLV